MSSTPPSLPQFSGGSQSNRRSFFGRRFSNSSSFSLASINTILPQYSAIDALGPGSPLLSDDTSRSPRSQSTSRAKPSPKPPNSSSPLGSAAERFEYVFPIRPSNSWCTLRLFTENLPAGNPRVSHHKPKTPKFWGGQIIAGLLELELDRPQTIQSISLTLRGKVVTGSLEGGSYNFLDHDIVLWDKSSGDAHFDGKFVGDYKFPFSFPFPTDVDLANSSAVPASTTSEFATTQPPSSPTISAAKPKKHSRGWSFASRFNSTPEEPSSSPTSSSEKRKSKPKSILSPQVLSSFSAISTVHDAHLQPITRNRDENASANIYPMPQSFLETQVTVNVGYELSVHIVHGRFRPDSRIKTNISYVPSIHAKPCSFAGSQPCRETVGQRHSTTCWFALPTVSLGVGVNGKEEEVECTLQLAQPLSYTRGTSISCRLMLSSSSSEAINIASKTDVPRVRLRRQIRYFGASDTRGGGLGKSNVSPLQEQSAMGVGQISCEASAPFQGHLPDATARSGKGKGEFVTLDKEVGTCLWRAPGSTQSRAWEFGDEKVNLDGRVCLEGEIPLAHDMQPSCACPIFCVEYFVELVPFHIAGMHVPNQDLQDSNLGTGEVLTKQLIEVATLYPSDEEIM
ncbi:hypothetical protein M413DRAFT_368864 [Hebeloma cylindrosporum]|uniref:Arrestin-like N-terminal domain-containing protein n=1 Tax=Hebeloma cylindrosporum TaxID=76867 RepID=A0A0C2Y264_HEBCY|nr:hypothetical protein M413DRAFT_368864 [Hebeloma cylindrosporum h7]